MKKITQQLVVLILTTLINTQLFAQSTANESLDLVISSTEVIQESTDNASAAVRTITIAYIFGQQPNTSGFLATINRELSIVEEYSDEMNQYAYFAERLSENDLDTSDVRDAASQIEGIGDYVEINARSLATAIEADDQIEATRLIRVLNRYLQNIQRYAEEARDNAEELKAIPASFKVRIELVDYAGNPVSADTLPGYVATNTETNEFFYAGENQGDPIDVFLNLSEGTYRFDAYDGYFDGASSKVVTLSSDLVNTDGEIVVTLNYWSE
ncbi:hypothetical protein [Tenacibaculum agarivorans]|uniref:hypothetical protein n=1 Tax=Tenacibaculum agarivorans TaxID=1908389 RepID=UPI00094BAEA9|nr:hypothetical protein [Tenacibaculum agarivorans]